MYWLLKRVVLGPLIRLLCRPSVTGELPAQGPVIIAANHLSQIDSLVLAAALPRRLTFLAKAEYFHGVAGWFYGLLCRATGQIPVERQDSEHANTALDAARSILDSSQVWAVYPEGTRSPDGRLYRGRTGVIRVALSRPDAVLVPVGLSGTDRVDPIDRRGWRRGRVAIDIGDPMDLSRWHPCADDPASWREATDELMRTIRASTGQDYVEQHAR